jgi:hypothetical protein
MLALGVSDSAVGNRFNNICSRIASKISFSVIFNSAFLALSFWPNTKPKISS